MAFHKYFSNLVILCGACFKWLYSFIIAMKIMYGKYAGAFLGLFRAKMVEILLQLSSILHFT